METKFTPGPWLGKETLIEDSRRGFPFWVGEIIGADGDRIVANLPDYRYEPSEVDEDRANICLIAAAPDLLEALQELLASVEGVPCGPELKCRAAIAKATGGAE